MKSSKMFLMLLATFVIAALAVAQADTIVLVTSPIAGSPTVAWSQLGPAGTTIPHFFVASGSNGDAVTGAFAAPSSNTGTVIVQGANWSGNFNPGDVGVWTVNHGPLSLSFFVGGYNFAGAYFQQNTFGAFTAKLDFYNGATLLGSVSENGNSTSAGDGSAIFIGGLDLSGSNITRVVFSETAGTNLKDFAITTLYYGAVPEPGTLVLVGTGLIGLAGIARRRMSR
jgi:hypothetical protein